MSRMDHARAVEEAVQASPPTRHLVVRGGGTKAALSTAAAETKCLDLSQLAGIVEYEPGEFTVTALAGTPVAEVQALLAENGQYLPFDPLLAEAGATLGGTVAAGTTGPGRVRYGGVRDFLLGAGFVDGTGRFRRGGAGVVKNAAGFDLPKLMVGSLGRLGVLVELTFKVFPRPEAHATLRVELGGLDAAISALGELSSGWFELAGLDLDPPGTLWIRLAGLAEAVTQRMDRLREWLGSGDVLEEAAEEECWRQRRELAWLPENASLVKVPLTPRRIPAVDEGLATQDTTRRYSAGGQVAWIAWQGELTTLDRSLGELDLRGLRLTGPAGPVLLGASRGGVLLDRVKKVLDPEGRFPRL
jgi:glycolate oxidase FAD binding subunit